MAGREVPGEDPIKVAIVPRGGVMRVLVTGGLGVNGSWVTRRLLERGHEPVVFDFRPDTALIEDIAGEIELVEGDVRGSRSWSTPSQRGASTGSSTWPPCCMASRTRRTRVSP